MSYQVLARKWRPSTFKEMVGQEHVLQALINALDTDRLHHAYLFSGTRELVKPLWPVFWPSASIANMGSAPNPAASVPPVLKSPKAAVLT